MSNFDEIMDQIEKTEEIMDKVNESFARMSRGGVINTSLGTNALVGNLRRANAIFKKIDKLTKIGGDSYTDEEKRIIEEKAKELTQKYTLYLELINKANDIAKDFMKSSIKVPIDAVKGAIGLDKKEKNDEKNSSDIDGTN
ncbi:MAG: hypothetical protein QXL94_03955 [Candidatus Parvarchaeum sp.]